MDQCFVNYVNYPVKHASDYQRTAVLAIQESFCLVNSASMDVQMDITMILLLHPITTSAVRV